jgi:SAM-dependent methyltransferase
VKPSDRILDFGCGDLSLAIGLKRMMPSLDITGVDVVDAGVRQKGITCKMYDGKKLPFRDQSFNTTIVYHVFHHCDDPHRALVDVMRVTKNRILMVEPVYRISLDIFFMKILDRLGNGWRNVMIPMPFAFQKEKTYITWAKESGWNVAEIRAAGVLPGWLPFGETKLFIFEKGK